MIVNYPFPDDTHILVKQGEKINFDTPFFEKKVNKEISINIAKELEINPKNIFRYLVKLVGESVNKNDIIALKKGLFSTKKVVSPAEGIIKEINHNIGLLILEITDNKKKQILSPFIGEVVKLTKNQVEINLEKNQKFSLKKSSSDFGGKVVYIESDSAENNLLADIVEDNIILAEKISSFIQVKSEALGAKGFITLQPLPQSTEKNFAILKNINDIKKILKNKFSSCTIISKYDIIYFYQ